MSVLYDTVAADFNPAFERTLPPKADPPPAEKGAATDSLKNSQGIHTESL